MRFLDANVFLAALLAKDEVGAAAQRVLAALDAANPACTSVLVLDEVFWVLRKRHGSDGALEASRRLMTMPGLRVLAVQATDWSAALGLMEDRPAMKPRDALHAATALSAGCDSIVSTDADFDRLPGLKRVSP